MEGECRPSAPQDCAACGGCRKLHRNGCYHRYFGAGGEQKVPVQTFVCPQCGRTVSVIPKDMFPYRSLPVARFEALVDGRLEMAGGEVLPGAGDADGPEPAPSAGGGARPPPASRVESGCVRRALEKLSERIPLLCGLLGQQMPLPQGSGIGWFWPALRQLGSTESILIRLARDFKTSLLACYRSLRAR